MKKIEGSPKNLKQLLQNTKYSIHYYQREYMWHLLVLSHGVFVNISNGDNSIKTLLLIVCNFMVVERDCRKDTKKEPHC